MSECATSSICGKILNMQLQRITLFLLIFQANHERDPLNEGALPNIESRDLPDNDLKKSEATATEAKSTSDVEKELEDELEKDLEGLDIDDVDTTDVNLDDEDLLEDD